jgi:hypothetical protein
MLCLKCRYSLSALPRGVCPECGKEFDPADPATFFVPRMFMLRPGWSRAPDRVHFAVAGLASAFLLASYWNVATNLLLVSFGGGVWLALLATASTRAALRAVPPKRHRLRVGRKPFWKRTAILSAMALLTACLMALEVPLKMRYLLNYSDLRAVADELERSELGVIDLTGNRPKPPGAIAAFRIAGGQSIEVVPPITRSLPWNDSALFDGRELFVHRRYRGVARVPNLAQRNRTLRDDPSLGASFHEVELEHMWGNWYLFRWRYFGS